MRIKFRKPTKVPGGSTLVGKRKNSIALWIEENLEGGPQTHYETEEELEQEFNPNAGKQKKKEQE